MSPGFIGLLCFLCVLAMGDTSGSKMATAPKQVIKITNGLSVATGYSFANMVLIEGDNGLIVVDSTGYPHTANEAYIALTKNTNKTLKAIILTHFHLDHIGGANFLKQNFGNENTTIISFWSMENERSRFARATGFYMDRIAHHFGKNMYPRMLPCMRRDQPCLDTATVTHTVKDGEWQTIEGVRIQFLHTRGETDDQMSVWIPGMRAVVAADTVYPSFPNMYTLRGTPARDAFAWHHSVTRLQELHAEHLVLCHGAPVRGAMMVDVALTMYRVGIKFVHDQTLRLMNEGRSYDEIVARVRLPPAIAASRILNQLYGKVEWSVRGIYDYYNGWFDGDVTHVYPLSKSRVDELTIAMLSLPGELTARERLLSAARQSLRQSEKVKQDTGAVSTDLLVWALRLCHTAAKIEQSAELHALTVEVAKALVDSNESNMIANNIFLVYWRRVSTGARAVDMSYLHPVRHLPLRHAFENVPFRFKAEQCDPGLVLRLLVHVSDSSDVTEGAYSLNHCVIQHFPDPDPHDFEHRFNMTSRQFREVFSKQLSPNTLAKRFEPKSLQVLVQFLNFLD